MTSSPRLVDEIGQFTVIPNWIVKMGAEIGPDGLALVLALRYHSGAGDSGSFPSYDTLQSETGLTRRRIAQAIRRIESLGILDRKRRFGQSTVYTIKTRISTAGGLLSDGSLVQQVDSISPAGGLSLVQGVHTNKSHLNKTQLTKSSPPEPLFDDTPAGKARIRIVRAMNQGSRNAENIEIELMSCFHISPNLRTKAGSEWLLWMRQRPEGQTLKGFADWWYASDWRGKNGQPPTLGQIREFWPSAFLSASGPRSDPAAVRQVIESFKALRDREPTEKELIEICSKKGIAYEPAMAA